MSPIKVILADAHELFMDGFERIIEDLDYPQVRIIGRATTADGLRETMSKVEADIVFMELNINDEVFALIPELQREFPGELTECVNEIMIGNRFLATGLQITPSKNGDTGSQAQPFEDRFLLRKKLTRREQEVLELIAKAMNNKEIADQLYISDQTVGVHRKNIMRKLGVRNTVNLIKFAIDHQLV